MSGAAECETCDGAGTGAETAEVTVGDAAFKIGVCEACGGSGFAKEES